MTGGVIAYLLLVEFGTSPAISADYLALRDAIYLASRWVIMPSMVIVLASGLLAMAVHHPFQNMLWVWIKALTGLLVFEATLASVDGPARRAAAAAAEALDGQLTLAELDAAVRDHIAALWILLALFAVNVVLGIFRPRFRKRPAADTGDA